MALHHLDALAVQLDDVVDRVGVELQVLVHRVAERLRALRGEAERIELAEEDGAAADRDELVDDVLPAGEARPRDRGKRLDAVVVRVEADLAVALVDLLHPLDEQLVAVAALEDADLVVEVGGPVEARADLDLVVEEEREPVVVHQRQVR